MGGLRGKSFESASGSNETNFVGGRAGKNSVKIFWIFIDLPKLKPR